MNIDLRGKKAFVCGSTKGIGKAAAIELSKAGASIILIARNEESLKKTLRELQHTMEVVHDYIVADFSKPEELRQKVEAYVISKGPVHILVNNSGGPSGGPITSASTEEFLKTFNAHLICNQILAQAVFEGMKSEKYGRIINIISTSVKQPLKNLGVSNTIRAAVANWSKTWANEVGQFGITVNNILPGATMTSRLKEIIKTNAEKNGKTEKEIEEEMLREIPMKRFADPEETAKAICFLASPLASYITGINLPVDGGRTSTL